MNWFRRFMTGRYGSDALNLALLLLSVILTIVSRATGLEFLLYVAYAPLAYTFFRMFSRNISRRRMENAGFIKVWSPVKRWIVQHFTMFRQRKEYHFFRCPSCKTMVRVPRGRGKLSIHCPKCRTSFVEKT